MPIRRSRARPRPRTSRATTGKTAPRTTTSTTRSAERPSQKVATRTRDPSPATARAPARATESMRLAGAELLESREILPGQWLQAFHAPDLVTGARAGQFVHV